jgi:hypothetical protein
VVAQFLLNSLVAQFLLNSLVAQFLLNSRGGSFPVKLALVAVILRELWRLSSCLMVMLALFLLHSLDGSISVQRPWWLSSC